MRDYFFTGSRKRYHGGNKTDFVGAVEQLAGAVGPHGEAVVMDGVGLTSQQLELYLKPAEGPDLWRCLICNKERFLSAFFWLV